MEPHGQTGAVRITLSDVARLAGVALSTASLVFSGRGPVADSTAERVRAAARELGYAGPDRLAARLRTGRTRVIGVSYDGTLSSAFSDPFQISLLDGVAQVLDEQGYGLLLLPRPLGAEPTPLAAHGMDAVLFALCGTSDPQTLDQLAARGIVMLGTGAPSDPRVVQLTIPDRGATAEAVHHLQGLGHQRIGHVTMPLTRVTRCGAVPAAEVERAEFADSRDRALGFLDGGGSSDLIAEAAGFTIDAGAAATAILLDREDRPTALVCQSDLLAVGAIRAAAARGFDVPGQLSVIGFDGVDLPWFAGRLTTLDQNGTEKGRTMGRMALALLDGEPVTSAEFPVHLRMGTTTGPRP